MHTGSARWQCPADVKGLGDFGHVIVLFHTNAFEFFDNDSHPFMQRSDSTSWPVSSTGQAAGRVPGMLAWEAPGRGV